ncbi:hypothetical protein [Amycolatopsis sp. NPDC057786]
MTQFRISPIAWSSDQPSGTGTAPAAGMTMYSAKAPPPVPTT